PKVSASACWGLVVQGLQSRAKAAVFKAATDRWAAPAYMPPAVPARAAPKAEGEMASTPFAGPGMAGLTGWQALLWATFKSPGSSPKAVAHSKLITRWIP